MTPAGKVRYYSGMPAQGKLSEDDRKLLARFKSPVLLLGFEAKYRGDVLIMRPTQEVIQPAQEPDVVP